MTTAVLAQTRDRPVVEIVEGAVLVHQLTIPDPDVAALVTTAQVGTR